MSHAHTRVAVPEAVETPGVSMNDQMLQRRQKLDSLRAAGVNVYGGVKLEGLAYSSDVRTQYAAAEQVVGYVWVPPPPRVPGQPKVESAEPKIEVPVIRATLAGRLMIMRVMGNSQSAL